MNDRKCRLCLSSPNRMIDIFSGIAANMKIPEKINTFCHIKISETDNASREICFTCMNEVNRFADFYKRVKDNQKLLESAACEMKTEEETTPEEDQKKDEFVNKVDDSVQKKNQQKTLETFEVCLIDEQEQAEDIKIDLNEDDATSSIDSECEEIVLNDHDDIVSESALYSESEEIITIVQIENEPQSDNYDECETTKSEEALVNQTDIRKGKVKRAQHYIALDKPIRDFFGLRCDRCQEDFQTFQSMRFHMTHKHNERLFFDCCNRKLYRRDSIMEHIDSHLDPYKFKCDICNQVCKSKITLKVHLKQHIPKDQQPFPCEKCGDRFALNSQLKSHMKSHLSDEEKKFVCNECGKAFAFNFVLEKHKKNMHIRQRNYMCEICARSFVDKVNLTSHKRTHDIMAPRLECPKCKALLKSTKTLKIHMRIHNPSKFTCEQCDLVYPTKNRLYSHIQYAHTNKKYPCETCGRVFKKALNLKEHMSTHTGEFLYECEYCDKTFKSKANLYGHTKRIHPGEWTIKQILRRRSD